MTFAVGLRCFSDFDKGLTQAKVQSQYARVATLEKIELTGNYFSTKRSAVPEKVIYSSPNSPGVGGERQSNYLDRRLSIE